MGLMLTTASGIVESAVNVGVMCCKNSWDIYWQFIGRGIGLNSGTPIFYYFR